MALAAGVAVLVSGAPAQAHGGPVVYSGPVGPYYVSAYAVDLYGGGVDYTGVVLNGPGGDAAADITVSVEVTTTAGPAVPTSVTAAGGGFEAIVPGPIGPWTVSLNIRGARGSGSITHSLTAGQLRAVSAVQDASAKRRSRIVAGAIGVALALGVGGAGLALRHRRRGRRRPVAGDSGDGG